MKRGKGGKRGRRANEATDKGWEGMGWARLEELLLDHGVLRLDLRAARAKAFAPFRHRRRLAATPASIGLLHEARRVEAIGRRERLAQRARLALRRLDGQRWPPALPHRARAHRATWLPRAGHAGADGRHATCESVLFLASRRKLSTLLV